MLKEFSLFLNHIAQNRKLLFLLIKNDFKKEYLGSYLGLIWAFVQPLTYMSVIWFVFTYGFKSAPHGDTPYFLWLASGMIPWFFLSSALMSGTNAITSNSFLVKKVAFRVSILPLVKIGSVLILHFGLLIFLIFMFLLYGYRPTLYWLQLPFFILCSMSFVLAISWLTSSIRVFVKDIANFISVLLQIGFWATPIFWNIEIVPAKYQWILKLNPAYYIVEGYRDTLINHIWFWQMQNLTIYFLTLTAISSIIGATIFRKLRPHFGDVL